MLLHPLAAVLTLAPSPSQPGSPPAQPGNRVLTSSGIVATVLTVKDESLTARSADTKLEILKSAVAEITERGAGSSES